MKRSVSLLWLLTKVAISVALIAVIIGKIDFSSLNRRLDSGVAAVLLSGAGLLAVNTLIVGTRWWLLLRRLGVAVVSARDAIAITYVSVFVGQVLPGVIGADALRGWLCFRRKVGVIPILLSLSIDRLLALLALCGVAAAACYWQFGAIETGIAAPISVVAAVLIAAAAAGFWFLPALVAIIARRWPRWHAAQAFLDAFRTTALSCAGALGLTLSGIVVVLTVTSVLLLARGLAIGLPASVAYLVVPAAVVLSALPISFGGWGVREAGLSYGLTLFGVASDDAALLGLVFGIMILLSSLPGGLAMLVLGDWSRPRIPRAGPAQ